MQWRCDCSTPVRSIGHVSAGHNHIKALAKGGLCWSIQDKINRERDPAMIRAFRNATAALALSFAVAATAQPGDVRIRTVPWVGYLLTRVGAGS